MAELDAGSPTGLVAEFRQAVAQLKASSPRTEIGNALHAAANLLYRYGKPGNEKLIVLVSDGAKWHPSGTDGTGEVRYAVDEPVSLMAHLHRDRDIKLHAIGISTKQMFTDRGTWPMREALIPNHDLLGALVDASGGDRAMIGGLDVLEGYFSGLGAGFVHRVAGTPARLPSAGGGAFEAPTLAALRKLAGPEHSWDTERIELRDELGGLVGTCGEQADRVLGRIPWEERRWSVSITRDCGRTVSDDADLGRFLTGFCGALAPQPKLVGRVRALVPFAALLDQLLDAATSAKPDYGVLALACGGKVTSAAQAQVTVLRRVRTLLVDLRDELIAGPAAPPPAPPAPRAPAAGGRTSRYDFSMQD